MAAFGGAALVGAAPAQAATGCGSRCDGKNPQTFIWRTEGPAPGSARYCYQDAKTPSVQGKTFKKLANSSIYIELRYSPDCRTAWARTNAVNWTIYVYSYNSSGSLRKSADQTTNDSVKYTVMLNDAGYTAKACIVVPVSGGEQVCTDKY